MKQEVQLEKFQQERLERMVDRVIGHLSEQKQRELVWRDARLQNLYNQEEKAVENRNYLSQQIIQRQMKCRIDELLSEYAMKVIKESVATGDIIFFLDEDQKALFDSIRGRIYMTMDVLNSALNDMTGFIFANGLQGTCKFLTEISTARNAIDKWCIDTIPALRTECAELSDEECDRIYDYVCKRVEVLSRKANRILAKEEKK